MSTTRLRVIGVGEADALRAARRDARLDLMRCEDALDALALATSTEPRPDAMVFDAHAASLEDMTQVADAARRAGLPEPIVLDPQAAHTGLYESLRERARAEDVRETGAAQAAPQDFDDEMPDEAHEALGGVADALEAMLEGDSGLETLLERCAAFGVRLVDADTRPDAGYAGAPIVDEDGDALAMLVGPAALAPLLGPLARACSSVSRLDDAIDDLVEDASTDATSGLPDREALLEELELRIDEARPAREPFMLALARLGGPRWDDPDEAHAIAERAEFGAVVAWGVLGLVVAGDDADAVVDAITQDTPAEVCVAVVYPWDGAEAGALLEEAEALLRAVIQTDTV